MSITPKTIPGFGLIVIGSEVLDGRVQDKHFAAAQEILRERHIPLAYAMTLPDDPEVIDAQLRWAIARPEPFCCCGGIGSTPDDHTRQCAARVTGRPLDPHPEGVAILEARLGKPVTGARLRLVEFPKDAVLIPNPVNQVPGFSVGDAHFVPGFPNMARPMMAWVLDTYYASEYERVHRSLLLPGAREADLTELMETFIAAHPDVTLSSLPRFTAQGTEVEIGLTGPSEQVAQGLRDLKGMLDEERIEHRHGER